MLQKDEAEMRREAVKQTRHRAAELSTLGEFAEHISNGDEHTYSGDDNRFAMSFTKGLEHDCRTGLLARAPDYQALRDAIDQGCVRNFTAGFPEVPHKDNRRKWEAPTAGFVFDLQGSDAQKHTMAPAPELGSTELVYEMAEVYELALLRDQPLEDFCEAAANTKILDACKRLNAIGKPEDLTSKSGPARHRTTLNDGYVSPGTVFRGSGQKTGEGPYLSQFLLMGSRVPGGDGPDETSGLIQYGAQTIDQRVPLGARREGDNSLPRKDWMQSWGDWLDVQNGRNVRNNASLFSDEPRRFITTPRDLATYVHDDALYQAYLNACIILLGQNAPFDPHFDALSGMGTFESANAGGFALYGGPHILSLVTEVATRGLKAVRWQKFNTHMRLRPEALAGRIEAAAHLPEKVKYPINAMAAKLDSMPDTETKSLLQAVRDHNALAGEPQSNLLPMAFQEGSPMHPSYGAGHATVAGACVTVLKAFFDTDAVLMRYRDNDGRSRIGFRMLGAAGINNPNFVRFQPSASGYNLSEVASEVPLSLEGELNKLAANISIGRNMAGVHFYTDYYDSLRLGEQIACSILSEQAVCYPKDPFVMKLVTFDGEEIELSDAGQQAECPQELVA